MKTETLGGFLALARKQFLSVGIETAALDARLLLQAATGFAHEDLIAVPDQTIEPHAAAKFQDFIRRRMAHEPVSRILGEREFYGRKFRVTPDVLDPRPDTETLVSLALRHVPQGRFLDLGTGSGAIAVTLCAENPKLSGIAADISAAALGVAQTNAENLGVLERLTFHHGSWLEGIDGRFDLIVSNPPYIVADEGLPPEVQNYDPSLALFGGSDGLEAYQRISQGSAGHLTTEGIVAVEIGASQAGSVRAIFEQQGFALLAKAKDLAGHVRALAFRTL